MSIMGLDIGRKRIGVAISDPLEITAQPAGIIERTSLPEDLAAITSKALEKNVSAIVVGLPLTLRASFSAETEHVVAFTEALRNAVDIPVETWDERLSTVAAERSLLEGDLSRRKRKQKRDTVAAQLILQGYLDYRRSKTGDTTL